MDAEQAAFNLLVNAGIDPEAVRSHPERWAWIVAQPWPAWNGSATRSTGAGVAGGFPLLVLDLTGLSDLVQEVGEEEAHIGPGRSPSSRLRELPVRRQ